MAGITKAEREARAAAQADGKQPDGAAGGSADQAGGEEQAGADAQDQSDQPAAQLVPMVRSADSFPEPHTADVHPDEVSNYATAGWQLA